MNKNSYCTCRKFCKQTQCP